jgi:hypothetical protein
VELENSRYFLVRRFGITSYKYNYDMRKKLNKGSDLSGKRSHPCNITIPDRDVTLGGSWCIEALARIPFEGFNHFLAFGADNPIEKLVSELFVASFFASQEECWVEEGVRRVVIFAFVITNQHVCIKLGS